MEFKDIVYKIPAAGETILYYFDEVTQESVKVFTKDLNTMHMKLTEIEQLNTTKMMKYMHCNGVTKFPITIKLSTPGGSCYYGFSLCSTLSEISKQRDVDIQASGLVASMGIAILLSVPLEHRCASRNTTFMIHQVWGITLGEINHMEDDVKETKRIHEIIWDMIEKNSKISKEKLNEVYECKKDWYISAEEALELGLISKIIN